MNPDYRTVRVFKRIIEEPIIRDLLDRIERANLPDSSLHEFIDNFFDELEAQRPGLFRLWMLKLEKFA